jgi:beta-lactamase regulating signal transducer with metallopeptidase domain
MLLNWILQGVVLAVLAWALLRGWRFRNPQIRYSVWQLAQSLVALLPAVSIGWGLTSPSNDVAAATVVQETPVVTIPSSVIATAGTAVMLAWVVWAIAQGARALAGLRALARLKSTCTPIDQDCERRLCHWNAVAATGRQARLVVSDRLQTAAVLGLRNPVIAISPQLLDALSDEDLDRVVLHEWAHVQRRDDWAGLLQVAIRMLAGFHPAIRWAARELHREREAACDHAAVSITGSPRAYAACLIRLAAVGLERTGPLVPAVRSGSELSDRVLRLLHTPAAAPSWRSRAALGAALGFAALFVARAEFVTLSEYSANSSSIEQRAAVALNRSEPAAQIEPGIASVPVPAVTSRRSARPPFADAAPRPAPHHAERKGVPLATDESPAEPPRVAPQAAAVARPGPPIDQLSVTSGLPQLTAGAVATVRAPSALLDSDVGAPAEAPSWDVAVKAATSIGRGSQKAALSTAGYFTRFGKKLGGSF